MTKTKLNILLALFLVFVLVSSYCYATVEPRTSEPVPTSEESATPISEEENTSTTETPNWTNHDLYLCQDNVTISNVVDGNAFIIGKEVTISGEIGGDLFVVAEKLNIEGGYIYSSLFACAKEITLNGVVYDVYAACNNFTLDNSGFIYRDMRVTASNITINGKVRRDAYLSPNTIQFAESTETAIYGNLQYSSNSELSIPENAVAGEVTYNKLNVASTHNVGSIILSYVLNLLRTLLFTFVATLIFVWLTPKFIDRVGNSNVAKSFISLGIGFATPIALVLVSFLLILSGIGLPIFICGLFAFIILAFIGTTVASIFFGKLLTKLLKIDGTVKFILFTLVSALIIWAFSQIPVVGGIFSFIISLFGIGLTLVHMVWRKDAQEVKTEVKE